MKLSKPIILVPKKRLVFRATDLLFLFIGVMSTGASIFMAQVAVVNDLYLFFIFSFSFSVVSIYLLLLRYLLEVKYLSNVKYEFYKDRLIIRTKKAESIYIYSETEFYMNRHSKDDISLYLAPKGRQISAFNISNFFNVVKKQVTYIERDAIRETLIPYKEQIHIVDGMGRNDK